MRVPPMTPYDYGNTQPSAPHVAFALTWGIKAAAHICAWRTSAPRIPRWEREGPQNLSWFCFKQGFHMVSPTHKVQVQVVSAECLTAD